MHETCAALLLTVDQDLALTVDLFEVEVAAIERDLRMVLGHAGTLDRDVVSEGATNGSDGLVDREGARRPLAREPADCRHGPQITPRVARVAV